MARPQQVLSLTDAQTAVVTRAGVVSQASLLTAEAPVHPGDWVLVHSGFVLARLSDDDVRYLDELTQEGSRP
jgi:hydrogenase maturation factor